MRFRIDVREIVVIVVGECSVGVRVMSIRKCTACV